MNESTFFKNLTSFFSSTLPLVISFGKKGSGKTHHFFKLCNNQNYKTDGVFFPFLRSTINPSEPVYKDIVKLTPTLNYNALLDKINTGKKIFTRESEWKSFWENEIIIALVGNNSGITNYHELNDYLAKTNKKVIIIIDSLEDIFSGIRDDKSEQLAIKTLLNIPNRLIEFKNRSIGFILFMNPDNLSYVLTQNNKQFEARFMNFKLD